MAQDKEPNSKAGKWLTVATMLVAVFGAAVIVYDGTRKPASPARSTTHEELHQQGIAKLALAFHERAQQRTNCDVAWMWARYGYRTLQTSEFAQVAGTSFLRATVTKGGETFDTRATCENRQCIVSGMTRKL